jgi:pimeloyl-ACP methyl ester carboxylesterase
MRLRRRGRFRRLRTLLAVIVLLAVGVTAFAFWLVYGAAHPPHNPYLAKPEEFASLSVRGVKVAEESWTNPDQTQAHGWLLRGEPGKPAVIILHRYGADRSWLLNLGVKLNEATNFTIFWPDLRGHGETASVKWTSFGGCETEDMVEAIRYVRSLKGTQGEALVGDSIGVYGVELGAYVGLMTAANDASVRALALDSVPASSEDELYNVVRSRSAFDFGVLRPLSRLGARIYLMKCYRNIQSCQAAKAAGSLPVLLLTGSDAPTFRSSTVALADCFADKSKVQLQSDLPLTGMNLPASTGEQSEAYDRRIIDFFGKALNSPR